MIDAFIIMVGICISVALLSHADIKIKVTHCYPTAPVPVQDTTSTDKLQEQITEDEAKLPTMDDVLKAVHEYLGGIDNGE
jgi:hypothetical protein